MNSNMELVDLPKLPTNSSDRGLINKDFCEWSSKVYLALFMLRFDQNDTVQNLNGKGRVELYIISTQYVFKLLYIYIHYYSSIR